eukprot:COSAG04_NODE_515_length_13209_cov_19.059115_5_plen_115_part_00
MKIRWDDGQQVAVTSPPARGCCAAPHEPVHDGHIDSAELEVQVNWVKVNTVKLVHPSVSIKKEAFAAACRSQPERTVEGDISDDSSSGWFYKLRPLELREERSCVKDLFRFAGL